MLSPAIYVQAPVVPAFAKILTAEALQFIADLAHTFEGQRQALLQAREVRQQQLDAGIFPDFLPHTAHIRQAQWTVAPIPPDLQDRRVEITGPVDRKMIINALNSGASVFMADFEDATSPTWENLLNGQINLGEAIRRTITYTNPEGKFYQLKPQTAVLMVRPRGWHLPEKHLYLDGQPISASLFDFGLFFFHNAHALLEKGTAPYFYLPKLENHQEARLWNDVFNFAQDRLNIPRSTIRATVLIENILAAFEMDEILYELRQHSAGLNCGRWDYIFSAIRKFRAHPQFLLPDRAQVTMKVPFMRAYSRLLIQTCHKRGIHAIGGMAAQIPVKNDPQANTLALRKVQQDKEREVTDGHDGTWVAHPALVPVAKEVFDQFMPIPNQLHFMGQEIPRTAKTLLPAFRGEISEQGLCLNIDVALHYLANWLGGEGCVPLYNLMEDAATAEISRAQLWQWVHHPQTRLSDGRKINRSLYRTLAKKTAAKLQLQMGQAKWQQSYYPLAYQLLNQWVLDDTFTEFLTVPAYHHLP